MMRSWRRGRLSEHDGELAVREAGAVVELRRRREELRALLRVALAEAGEHEAAIDGSGAPLREVLRRWPGGAGGVERGDQPAVVAGALLQEFLGVRPGAVGDGGVAAVVRDRRQRQVL